MSSCNRGEDIVAFLYGDHGDTDERRLVEEHLATCEACAREAAALGDVRAQLSAWVPPDVDLGFRIVREGSAAPARVLPFRRWAAVGGLAAAAVLVLAAAAAVANIEVRYGSDGLTVRSGWAPAAPAETAASVVPPASDAAAAEEWRTEIARLEGRLDAALARPEAPQEARVAGEAVELSQVSDLIAEAEKRQQSELALGLARLAQEFEVQRQADLVRVAQGIGRIETFTGAEVERQRAMLNHLLRVSQQQGRD